LVGTANQVIALFWFGTIFWLGDEFDFSNMKDASSSSCYN